MDDSAFANRHHSDLTVSIFSVLHLVFDPRIVDGGATIDARLSREMSRRTRQTWLCVNDFEVLRGPGFHSALVRAAQAVSNCYLSVCCLDPVELGLSAEEQGLLVESLLAANIVMKRKVIFIGIGEPRPSAYQEFVARYAGAPSDSLAMYLSLPAGPAALVSQRLADFILTI